MSKYNVGDKFIIEIAEELRDNLYRIKGFNSLVFDDNGLKKLMQVQEKFSDENHIKTRLEDFTEKYPNHTKDEHDVPHVCCGYLGYTDNCHGNNCIRCWDMPV